MKTKKAKTKAKPKPKIEELDLDPDAWPKFEKFLRSAAKTPRPPDEQSGRPAKKKA
jgi:hypothetical protein